MRTLAALALGRFTRPARTLAFATAISTCAACAVTPASAQTRQAAPTPAYPSKPIRLLTGAAGSPSDILARALGPKLTERWAQPVVLENRAGAAGQLAAAIVAKAPADGYTLLLISAQFAIGAALHSNLPYDPLKDFAGVTQLGYSTSALLVSPALGVKSVKEFIAYGQSRPGQILFSSGGAGSSTHISAETFRFAAGIKAVHVGFRGTPDALIEVLAGRVHYCIVGLGAALPFIKDGRLLALAVSTPQRSPLLPEVPAMTDVLPGYGREGSHSLLAPAGTPRPVLNQISKEVARVFDLPDVRERLQAAGFHLAPTTPEEHDRILRAQIETFSKIARQVGLKQ
ncbi:MAG TPA: tripartite tricarboxylate transporter substrate-binding protein [Burkholderiales bacterium]|nr:tripartite tricarboxylate transporter substrate-binding protein [Burkholderiales bacterium]